jgi:hypothetical protein
MEQEIIAAFNDTACNMYFLQVVQTEAQSAGIPFHA